MSRDEQIKAAAAAIRLCPAFADFSSPPMKCANEMAAAAVDAIAAQQDGVREAALDECAKIADGVAERNMKPGKFFMERVLTAQVIRDKINDLRRPEQRTP